MIIRKIFVIIVFVLVLRVAQLGLMSVFIGSYVGLWKEEKGTHYCSVLSLCVVSILLIIKVYYAMQRLEGIIWGIS